MIFINLILQVNLFQYNSLIDWPISVKKVGLGLFDTILII
jgi:hypothetical protein